MLLKSFIFLSFWGTRKNCPGLSSLAAPGVTQVDLGLGKSREVQGSVQAKWLGMKLCAESFSLWYDTLTKATEGRKVQRVGYSPSCRKSGAEGNWTHCIHSRDKRTISTCSF